MTASLTDQTILSNTNVSGPGPAPASWVLLANDDMRVYLQELIQHECACDAENCGFCQSAHHVYELVRSLIFSEVAYPEVTILARGRVTEAGNHAPGGGSFPMSRAA